ncbi:MAG: Gfo/Idh/MocA family oxidoreductase [Caulobacteraceae bacterium]|nr:Gfo/Idh/MocA family oxidoreductase [Caulobacteraceae bacterium]
MVAKPFRTAIIGLGAVAEPHIAAYCDLADVEVAAVVDPRQDRVEEICARYGVAGFSSCEALLAAMTPDIACVLTPAATHREITVQCAAAGVHVLCEKPMAVEVSDAEAMAAACDEAGVRFFYGSSYRYLPAVQAARGLIRAGAIGAVRTITERVVTGAGEAAYRPMSPAHYPVGGPGGWGYGLVDHGIHMLDVFPWLCDSPIDRLMGQGDRAGAAARPEYAVFALRSGAMGFLNYDGCTRPVELPGEGVFSDSRQWIAGRGWMGEVGAWDARPGHIDIHGGEGALRVFHYANKLFLNTSGVPREVPVSGRPAPWHFGRQLEDFCDALEQDRAPAVSSDDGLQALRALHAIYASEASGGWRWISAHP